MRTEIEQSIARSPPARNLRLSHVPGIVTITDANTTIGYCRYDDNGGIEYIFVGAAHRRRGIGMQLLAVVESRLDNTLRLLPPISPLGQRLMDAYVRKQRCGRGLPTRG
jgi:hypothetical protein